MRLTKVRLLDAASIVEMHGALDELSAFSLIRSSGASITMHSLTRAVLRALRMKGAADVWEHLRSEMWKFLDSEEWKGGHALSLPLLGWSRRTHEALLSAVQEPSLLEELPRAKLTELVTTSAAGLRGLRQLGSPLRELIRDITRALQIVGPRLAESNASTANEPAADVAAYVDLQRELFEAVVLRLRVGHGIDRTAGTDEDKQFQRMLVDDLKLCEKLERDDDPEVRHAASCSREILEETEG